MAGGKSKRRKWREGDMEWLMFVAFLPLLNVWVAFILAMFSEPEPLHTVFTDGSLIVFCLASVWISVAAFQQELVRSRPTRGSRFLIDWAEAQPFWRNYEVFLLIALVVTVVASTIYTILLLKGTEIEDLRRILFSLLAVGAGLVLSRRALVLAQTAARKPSPLGPGS